jgi:hypothetical protein
VSTDQLTSPTLGNFAPPFSEANLAAIERAFGRQTPDREFRDNLYFFWLIFLQDKRFGNVSLDETRDALARVRSTADLLIAQLKVRALSANALPKLQLLSSEILEFDSLATRLSQFSSGLERFLEKIGARKTGSRPADLARQDRLRALSEFEFENTGKRSKCSLNKYTTAYSGTIFLLFKTFEEALAVFTKEPLPTDVALAQFIRRNLQAVKTPVK